MTAGSAHLDARGCLYSGAVYLLFAAVSNLLGSRPLVVASGCSMKTLAPVEVSTRKLRTSAAPATTIDQVMAEESAAAFTKRSVKTSAKLSGLKLAISMMDLTTLEGKDTPGKVAFLCRKAMQPLGERYDVPPCAAVCVYPNLVRAAKEFLGDSGVKVASVATAFPSGLMPLRLKLADVRSAARDGADEIDTVIDRGLFLSGDHARVADEICLFAISSG